MYISIEEHSVKFVALEHLIRWQHRIHGQEISDLKMKRKFTKLMRIKVWISCNQRIKMNWGGGFSCFSRLYRKYWYASLSWSIRRPYEIPDLWIMSVTFILKLWIGIFWMSRSIQQHGICRPAQVMLCCLNAFASTLSLQEWTIN